MFKSYEVKGGELTVTLEHASEGLVVAETGTNSKSGLAIPTVVPNGADQVKLFYLAGEDRVWHPAKIVKIDGDKVTVSSPGVKSPRGVSYAMGGVGNQPNLYNKAMLPTTPFIYFDNKLVTTKDWPDDPLKVAGVVPDPNAGGLKEEYRKMPILSTQFCKNAVLQADKPVTIWGSAIHDWGYEAKGKAEIHFSFAGIEKTIPVTPGMKEWSVTLPPMKASGEPKTLKVTLTIDGELAHERIAEGIVFGDVWYVAAPALALKFPAAEKPAGIVRMMTARQRARPLPARGASVCPPRRPRKTVSHPCGRTPPVNGRGLGRAAGDFSRPAGRRDLHAVDARRQGDAGRETQGMDRRRLSQPRPEPDGRLQTTGRRASGQ